MVNIIVGKIHEGKTTKIIEIYDKMKKGDGFVSVKRIENNQVIGYDALHLSTKETYPFILKEDYLPKDWESELTLDVYSFSSQTLKIVDEKIDEMLRVKTTPIFLDEIGILEIKGHGFDKILRKLLASDCEIYMTIRDKFLDQFIVEYSIEDKNIISLS